MYGDVGCIDDAVRTTKRRNIACNQFISRRDKQAKGETLHNNGIACI